jgi:hypothetical protein
MALCRQWGRFSHPHELENIMKLTHTALSAALALACTSIAGATPVDEMVKQGFGCQAGTRGEVVCRKDGAPSKICNVEGSCFRIVYEGSALLNDQMKTGSVSNNHLKIKNANTEY